MKKKYYKVVTGSLKSSQVKYWWTDYREKYLVQYKIGEWVEPKVEGSSLMVFSSLEDALRFVSSNVSNHKIFECEIEGAKKNGIFSGQFTKIDALLSECKKLKKAKKGWTHLCNTTGIPKGTVFADRVKLIKEVAH